MHGPLSPNSSWPASIDNRPLNFGQVGATLYRFYCITLIGPENCFHHFLPGIRLRFLEEKSKSQPWKLIAETAGICQVALCFSYSKHTQASMCTQIYMPALVCVKKCVSVCLCIYLCTVAYRVCVCKLQTYIIYSCYTHARIHIQTAKTNAKPPLRIELSHPAARSSCQGCT